MRCPNCGHLPTPVLKTERPLDEGTDNIKRRRRSCRNCRRIFLTYEISESDFRKLYPKNQGDPARTPLKTKDKKDEDNDK